MARIEIAGNPTAVALADRPHPSDPLAAPVSLQHWAAVVMSHGTNARTEITRTAA